MATHKTCFTDAAPELRFTCIHHSLPGSKTSKATCTASSWKWIHGMLRFRLQNRIVNSRGFWTWEQNIASYNIANSTMTKGNTSLQVTSQNASLPRHKVSLSYGLSPVTTSPLWLNPNSTTDGTERAIK